MTSEVYSLWHYFDSDEYPILEHSVAKRMMCTVSKQCQ